MGGQWGRGSHTPSTIDPSMNSYRAVACYLNFEHLQEMPLEVRIKQNGDDLSGFQDKTTATIAVGL